MKLTSARRSIHDAFALHLGGPADNIGGGSVKFNSTKWLAKAGTAGLVIRAVMNQPAHIRGAAIFINAPENTVTFNDTMCLKQGLWGAFIRTYPKTAPDDQGILIGLIDRIMIGYRSRAWDANSSKYTAGSMFAALPDADAKRLTGLANKMLDILAAFDTQSLAPVWLVIDREKKQEEEWERQRAEGKKVVAKAMLGGKSYRDAKLMLVQNGSQTH